MSDDRFLRRAFELARSAVAHGNHPFGAVLVLDGNIVAEAENNVTTESDPTGHAETNLIRIAGKKLSKEDLARGVVYTSTEPCIMCCGAIYWAGVREFVFGFPETGLRDLVEDKEARNAPSLLTPCRELLGSRGVLEKFIIRGPLLEEEARDVHGDFWEPFRGKTE